MIKSFKIMFFFLKKTFATRKSIGLFFFSWWRTSRVLETKNKGKKPRNALKKIVESKFQRVTKMVSLNLLW